MDFSALLLPSFPFSLHSTSHLHRCDTSKTGSTSTATAYDVGQRTARKSPNVGRDDDETRRVQTHTTAHLDNLRERDSAAGINMYIVKVPEYLYRAPAVVLLALLSRPVRRQGWRTLPLLLLLLAD
jgi:hypothetical protein